jgi:hypothetical protein
MSEGRREDPALRIRVQAWMSAEFGNPAGEYPLFTVRKFYAVKVVADVTIPHADGTLA